MLKNKKSRLAKFAKISIIYFIFGIFVTMNAGCPHGHITTYMPILPGSISGTVRTFDATSAEGAVVFLAKDELLGAKVAQKTLKADGGFSFTGLEPGFYYIAAYKDMKGDGTYTVTEDYLGGKLVDRWDLENYYHPEVLENKDTVIDVPLLSPMKMDIIENGTNSISLNPKFSWSAVSGAAYYRVRVTSRKQSYWVIDTPATSLIYGRDPETGETVISKPLQLAQNNEYFWTVIAFREKYVPIAYSDISRFYTIIK